MADRYVPIFLDWPEVTRELNAQEKGRLIDAIVLFARGGDWQEQIKGNERYVFPTFQMQIERARAVSQNRAASGSAGGKQSQANRSKTEQTGANASKTPNKNNNENNNNNKNNEPVQERAREGWDEFVTTYENNLGLLPRSEVELSDLRMFFDEFGAEAICELIRQSARKHPDNPHTYFSAICRKHLGKGIKTAEQVKAAFMDFDRKHGKERDMPVNELVYADEDDFY